MLRPQGLRDRILTWYGGTVLAVLALVLLLIHVKVERETSHQVVSQMTSARRVVESLQRERTATLAMVSELAGKEPKLGAVMLTNAATIEDLLRQDLQKDLDAAFIRVTDARGAVLVDTSGRSRAGADLSHDPAVADALAGQIRSGTLVFPEQIYLTATAPISVGHQELGTVMLGRAVTDESADQLWRNTGSHVSFLSGGQLAATSWPPSSRPSLLTALGKATAGTVEADGTRRFLMSVDGQRMMSLSVPLRSENGGRGVLLIQSSLDAAQRPYKNIQQALALIGLLGFLAAVLGSIIVASGITRPLQRIAYAAQGLMQGDWTQRAPVVSRDEVGLLAETFNRMAERLESWDTDMRAAVTERTQELDAAVSQLDAAFQLMRQFNADASHELRTPLTVIRGEAEVALRAGRSAAEYQAVLRTIQDETEHMSRIIEQLLLLARADSGELRLERRRVALDDVVREAAHRAEVLARERRIRLSTASLEPLFIEGDEDQLRRLTLNLLHNAIKYTPEGGQVRIALHACPVENTGTATEAVMEVADTGVGISADHLPKIFDRFYRVDKSRSRAQGGNGLGLAICQWIVEGHGGRIEVKSSVGVGSTFTVHLPMVTDSAVEPSDLQMAEV